MTDFQLMNKDICIGTFLCNKDSIRDFKVILDTKNIHINDTFLESRLYPIIGRKNIDILLKISDIKHMEDFLKVSKAISFNDTLWVKEIGNKDTWNKISPYTNSISKIVAEIALNGEYELSINHGFRTPSPEYITGGTYTKCWKRYNKKIYMIKGGEDKYNSISGNSSYNEYFACQIAEVLGIKHYVGYEILEKTDRGYPRAFTRCELFTNEKHGYLSIGDSRFANITLGNAYKIMNKLGRHTEYLEMLLLDSLIYNIDRHEGNYGFITANDTYKIIDMAPIFDNNLAFLSNVSLRDIEELERQIRIQKPYTNREISFIRQGRIAISNSDELRKRLNNIRDFRFNREGIKYLEQERMDFMDKLVKHQITEILK